MAIDWGQTREIVRRHGDYHERNPLLAKHPTMGEVNRYFGLAMAGTAAACFMLPAAWRQPLLGGIFVLESVTVLHNRSIGLRFSF